MTRVDLTPPTPAVQGAPRGMVELALLVIGAEICRQVQYPVRAAGLIFAGVAVAVGIRLLRKRPRGQRPLTTMFLAFTMVAAVGLLIWHLAAIALDPLVGDYEGCMAGAQTRQARETCRADLVDRLERLG